MGELMSEPKQPSNETQKKFLDLVISGMTIRVAAEEVDYSVSYGYSLGTQFKEYILDGVQGLIYLSAVKAGNVVVSTMDADGKQPDGKLRLDAAKDVLDRAGLARQERLKLEIEEHQGVFILPAKADGDTDE
jgi:transposase